MKGILCKPEMSEAILAEVPGELKTVTRRPVQSPAKNLQRLGQTVFKHRTPGDAWYGDKVWSMRASSGMWGDYTHEQFLEMCPYGGPGDQLYIKETFWAWGVWETRFDAKKGRDALHFVDMTEDCNKSYLYTAPASTGNRKDGIPGWHKRPSLFMPSYAARCVIEIVEVELEWLTDISETDARAEGIEVVGGATSVHPYRNYLIGRKGIPNMHCSSPIQSFKTLWEMINGEGSWEANPLVWVLRFKRVL